MSEKVNPQGQVVETKDIDGVDGIIPRLTTDTGNAKVDFAGYLYKEKELDGIVGRMPVIALEDGELIDDITGATIGGEDVPISDGILQLPESYPDAERLNGKVDSEFATSEQGVKADSAVQSATIGGITVAKQASELQLPAYPTSLPADGGNADTVDGKHASDFATSVQGGKADIAVQAATIGGVAVIKNGTTLQLPAYPTTLPANGGDADTVDGKHAGDFAPSGHGLGVSENSLPSGTDPKTITGSGWFTIANPSDFPSDATITVMGFLVESYGNYLYLFAKGLYGVDAGKIWHKSRISYSSDTWTEWTRINDGGNADTVDGKHASDFSTMVRVSDWDSVTYKAGDVLVGSQTALNTPSTYLTCISLPIDNNMGYNRLLGIDINGKVWKRQQNSYTWGGWVNVADGGAASTAAKLANTVTLWGQPFDGTNSVGGSLNGVSAIEMFNTTPFIDFHHNNSSADFTSRIIEYHAGQLAVIGALNINYTASQTYYKLMVNGNSNLSGQVDVGGNITALGNIKMPYSGSTWLSMATRNDQILGAETNSASSAHSLFKLNNSTGSAIAYGGLGANIGFYGFYKSRIDAGENGTDWSTTWNVDTGAFRHSANFFVDGNVGIGTTSPSSKLHVSGDTRTNGWFITHGATGWRNSDYGGGFMMTDTTWIRVYGKKKLYSETEDDATSGYGASGPAAISTAGGISAGKTIWAGGNVRADGAFYDASDIRLKSNIEEVDTINVDKIEFKQYIKKGSKEVGVIAQQVQQYMPDAVVADGSEEAYLSVNYNSIFSAKCALYEKKISMQTEKISDLEKRLKRLEDLLNG